MTTIQLRIDEKLKREAQKIAEQLGMDLSTAVKVFLVQMTVEKGLPFRVHTERRLSVKEERYLANLSNEAMRHGKRHRSVDAMIKDILDE